MSKATEGDTTMPVIFGSSTTFAEQLRVRREAEEARRKLYVGKVVDALDAPRACNCIGPQAGETKCPCRLRAESQQGRGMVREGVVIDGVEYDLVPKKRRGATSSSRP